MAKIPVTLGQRLRAARLKAGYHKARLLAEDVGVTANTYYRYERDEATPAYKMLMKLAAVLNTPLSDLVADGCGNDSTDTIKDVPQPSASETSLLAHGEKLSNNDEARAYCSVLAWKLANELASKLMDQKAPDSESHLRLTAELYFALKTNPSAAMTRFYDSLNPDSHLWQRLFEYLSAYHSLLEKNLPRP